MKSFAIGEAGNLRGAAHGLFDVVDGESKFDGGEGDAETLQVVARDSFPTNAYLVHDLICCSIGTSNGQPERVFDTSDKDDDGSSPQSFPIWSSPSAVDPQHHLREVQEVVHARRAP